LEPLLVHHWWVGPILWLLAYLGDLFLTHWGASLWRRGKGALVSFDGSYELTPELQKDVDKGRIAPRLLVSAAFWAGLLGVIGQFVANDSVKSVYLLFLGGLLLVEIPVYLRHIRNLSWVFMTRGIAGLPSATFPRYIAYRLSGIELLAFAMLFLAAGSVTGSLLFFGGAASCALIGAKHLRLGKRLAGVVDAA
jgi:hypothetical protein